MANLAHVDGLSGLFEPNYVLNAYYFMTLADSPGYASYIIRHCVRNMTVVFWNFGIICSLISPLVGIFQSVIEKETLTTRNSVLVLRFL